MTYTGGFNATVPCTVTASQISASNPPTNSVDIEPSQNTDPSGADAANFSSGGAILGYRGPFTTGTFTTVDPNPNSIQSTATLQTKSGDDWEESFSNNGTVGTFSYNITSIGTPTATSSISNSYPGIHGTFTGTLPVLGGTLSDGGTTAENLNISF